MIAIWKYVLWIRNVSIVFKITSYTKVSSHKLKMSDLTRLLYYDWFPKPHTNIFTLTVSQCLFGLKKNLSTINAPPGVQGVSKNHIFFKKWNCFSFALRLPPKDTNFKNHQNWRKNVKKTLFSLTFSNLLHFGGNISAPNLK